MRDEPRPRSIPEDPKHTENIRRLLDRCDEEQALVSEYLNGKGEMSDAERQARIGQGLKTITTATQEIEMRMLDLTVDDPPHVDANTVTELRERLQRNIAGRAALNFAIVAHLKNRKE